MKPGKLGGIDLSQCSATAFGELVALKGEASLSGYYVTTVEVASDEGTGASFNLIIEARRIVKLPSGSYY